MARCMHHATEESMKVKDYEILVGHRFGSWEILGPARTNEGRRAFLCSCQCGAQRIVQARSLFSGRSTQCRQCASKKLRLSVGDRFGRWEIISSETKTMKGKVRWLCRCDCGLEKYVAAKRLS